MSWLTERAKPKILIQSWLVDKTCTNLPDQGSDRRGVIRETPTSSSFSRWAAIEGVPTWIHVGIWLPSLYVRSFST